MAAKALATAFVNIVPGTVELESYLKNKLGNDVENAGKKTGNKFAKGTATGFKKSSTGYFKPVLAGLAVSFGAIGVTNFARDMYSAAVESQKADAVLGQVTKSMNLFGSENDKVVSRLSDYADAMMRRTGIDDEVIKSTQAQLMSFKFLAASADETGGLFDRATAISADMAAVFGGDASGNAVKLGKALNDPVKGISSLSRVGVQFTDEQKAMIEGMVEAGDVAGAQALIMQELETQVGGTAEASATTGEKMKVALDDVTESLGLALLPAFEKLQEFVTNDVVPAFEKFNDGITWAKDNSEIVTPILYGLGTAMLVGLAPSIWAAVAATWAFTTALLANPLFWLAIIIGAVVASIVLLAKNWDKVTTFLKDTWAKFTDWISGKFESLKLWWSNLWDNFKTVAVSKWNSIKTALGVGADVAKAWLKSKWENVENIITKPFSSARDVIRGIFKSLPAIFKTPMNAAIKAINKIIRWVNKLSLKIPKGVPGLGGKTIGFDIKEIPELAKGGFVSRPTLALVGEAGPEVVTPLREFERMMGIGESNSSSRPIQVNNKTVAWLQELVDGRAEIVVNSAFNTSGQYERQYV